MTARPPRDFRAFARDTPPPEPTVMATPAVTRTIPSMLLLKLLNPAMRTVLRSPLRPIASRSLLLLHLTGRKTGRHYDIPVGYHHIDGQLAVLTSSGWRANVRGAPTSR